MNDGTRIDDEFLIALSQTASNSMQENPSITALQNNNFVVVWYSYQNSPLKFNIFGQIFTDNGIKVRNISDFPSIGFHSQLSPSIKSLPNGNFVVVWECLTAYIFAQIFQSDGNKLVSQFQVNTNYSNDKINPAISSVSTSNFMIVWQSQSQDGSNWGIYGQIFTSFGAKIGNEFRVNTYTMNGQMYPSIASLMNDNYVVTWQSNIGDGWDIYGQIFDNIGNKIGVEFKVNTITTSDQQYPSISSLVNSNFVILWNSNGQDGNGQGVYGNLYQIDGLMIGFNVCPLNCQSCANPTNCTICNPNFRLQTNSLCGCFDGFYFDSSSKLCISNFIGL